MKYYVDTVNGAPYLSSSFLERRKWASELQEEFGLHMFSLSEIQQVWEDYSEEIYSAGWLKANKDDVERAFDVVLEEIE